MTERRVALVSGARKGIGLDLVHHLLAQGYDVVGCSRKPSEVTASGYQHFLADVCDEKAVVEMFRGIRERYGRLDALINNAGIASMNHVLLTPAETVERILRTNVLGTFLLCREAAKLMRKAGGRIVNFGSVAVPLRLEGEAIYAASKAAVVTLTQVLARELAELKITVNVVGPSPAKTDLIKAVPNDKLDRLIARQAIPRYTELSDIRNAVDFFLKPESAFITGQVLYLGGV